MKFRYAYRTVGQFYRREPFSLSPATLSIELPQSRKFTDAPTYSKGFDVDNFAANLKKYSEHSTNRLFVAAPASPIAPV